VSVFLDSSALYAVFDQDDAYHSAARREWATLLTRSTPLVTSNYVLVESFALLQSRLGMKAVAALVEDVLPALEVEWVTSDDHRSAVSALLAANRRNLSLVDCTSFQVMRRLGVRSAFVFDAHFREQGFRVLPARL
jgi:predicted nucleic acid-binding protein